jgi:hypothetical protein
MTDDILEANQDRHLNALGTNFVHNRHQINPGAVAPAGVNSQIPARIDAEILVAPILNVIQLQ